MQHANVGSNLDKVTRYSWYFLRSLVYLQLFVVSLDLLKPGVAEKITYVIVTRPNSSLAFLSDPPLHDGERRRVGA